MPENDGKNGFWFTIKPVEIFKFLNINDNDFILITILMLSGLEKK